MAQHDFATLYAVFPTVIDEMPDVFTSHQFILRLAHQNQLLYIEALHTYRENGQPFASVHVQLSQHLYNFPALIEYVEHVESTDIFGNPNNCAKWRKR